MAYVPNEQDAIGAYVTAVAHRYEVSVMEVDWPVFNNVKEVIPGTFTIQVGGDDVVIAIYHERKELWIVRLEDGTILSVRKRSRGQAWVFVVE